MSDDTVMYHGEFVPSHAEFRAVGSLGIILFTSILCMAVFRCVKSMRRGAENRIHPMFYMSVACLALLDLPRYYAIAINAAYSSVQGYACHILSGICYFIALALVGYSFANLLELGHYASLLYSKRGLVAAVVLHAIIDFTGFIQCLRTARLADFFTSQYYQVFIVWDILQNLLYSGVLLYFGLMAIGRFGNLEKATSSGIQRVAFHAVVRKITLTLAVVSTFALLRLILLGVKSASLGNATTDKTFTTPIFPLYGVLWFLLADFLPRGGSTAAMMYLMQGDQGRRHGGDREGDDINSSGENSPVGHRGSGKSSDDSRGDCETALHRDGVGSVGMSCSTALEKVGSLLSSVRTGNGGNGGNGNTNAVPPRLGVMSDAFDDCFDVSTGPGSGKFGNHSESNPSKHNNKHTINKSNSSSSAAVSNNNASSSNQQQQGSNQHPQHQLQQPESMRRHVVPDEVEEDDEDGIRGGDDDEEEAGGNGNDGKVSTTAASSTAASAAMSPFHAPRAFSR